MSDELNPYPGNLKIHTVTPTKINFTKSSLDILNAKPEIEYNKELIETIIKELIEVLKSRLDENDPGAAIRARIQDLQHITQITNKYNLNIK
jgi:uncharacterized UPF0160 family protein